MMRPASSGDHAVAVSRSQCRAFASANEKAQMLYKKRTFSHTENGCNFENQGTATAAVSAGPYLSAITKASSFGCHVERVLGECDQHRYDMRSERLRFAQILDFCRYIYIYLRKHVKTKRVMRYYSNSRQRNKDRGAIAVQQRWSKKERWGLVWLQFFLFSKSF